MRPWAVAASIWMATAATTTAAQAPASIPALERRATTDSNDAVAHFELGLAYHHAARLDEAERAFRTAIGLAPQYAAAYLALAELADARTHHWWKRIEKSHGADSVRAIWEEHDRFFRRAFQIDPLVDPALLSRAPETPTLSIGGRAFRVWWAFPMAKAMNALRERKFDEAMARFEKVRADDRAGPGGRWAPDAALWYHGLAAAHLGRYDEAIADFWDLVQRTAAREADGELSPVPLATNEYRYALATVLYLDGQLGEAAPVFRRVLEFDAGMYMAHVQLARIHEARGEQDSAITARQAAINANPDDPSLVLDLGATLAGAGRLDEAQQLLADAARAAPHDARSWYLLGLVARQRGDSAAAGQAFERFLAVAPSRYAEQISEVRGWTGP